MRWHWRSGAGMFFHAGPETRCQRRPTAARTPTVDLAVIRRWWQQESDLNVAVATGEASEIFVVDIDGADGEAALRQIEERNGALPPTVEAITARGRHLYFKWPDRPVPNSAGKIAPHVDTRGTGGYVLAPPSIHPSGRRYCWSVDSARALAAAPEWLLAMIVEPASGPTITPPRNGASWRKASPKARATVAPRGWPACCCAITSTPSSPWNCCRPGTRRAARHRCRKATSCASSI